MNDDNEHFCETKVLSFPDSGTLLQRHSGDHFIRNFFNKNPIKFGKTLCFKNLNKKKIIFK